MAPGRGAGPSVGEGMVRLPATTAAGGGTAMRSSGGSLLDRLGEAVAHPEHRLDVALPDLLPDVLDVGVDRALVRLESQAAHRVEQLGTREHSAWLARHQGHDLELALRQIDASAGDARLHPWHVQLDVRADADHVRWHRSA